MSRYAAGRFALYSLFDVRERLDATLESPIDTRAFELPAPQVVVLH